MPPTLILLHGYGSDENDMRGLAAELNLENPVLCLGAPIPLDFGGKAWFDIEFSATEKRYDELQAIAARDALIVELETLHRAGTRILIGGFSQGAMIALGVAIARPELVSALFMMSGGLVPAFKTETPQPLFCRLPKIIQHGLADDVVPVREAQSLCNWLDSVGAEFEFMEYPMAHQVSLPSLYDLRRWILAKTLSQDQVSLNP